MLLDPAQHWLGDLIAVGVHRTLSAVPLDSNCLRELNDGTHVHPFMVRLAKHAAAGAGRKEDSRAPYRDSRLQTNPLSQVRLAAQRLRSLVVLGLRRARVFPGRVWHQLEHVYDARPVPGLSAPVALDELFALPTMVAARGLVHPRTIGDLRFEIEPLQRDIWNLESVMRAARTLRATLLRRRRNRRCRDRARCSSQSACTR